MYDRTVGENADQTRKHGLSYSMYMVLVVGFEGHGDFGGGKQRGGRLEIQISKCFSAGSCDVLAYRR